MAPQFAERRRTAARLPHMTWAKSSVGRTISRTGVFLKRQIWIWPIIAVVLLSVIGFFVRRCDRDDDARRLAVGAADGRRLGSGHARDLVPRARVERRIAGQQRRHPPNDLSAAGSTGRRTGTRQPTRSATLRAKLDKSLGPAITAHRYAGYIVADKKKRIVASGRPELIGQQDVPEYSAFLARALDGATNVSAPFPSVVAMKDDSGPDADGRAHDVRRRADPRRQLPGGRRARAADRSGGRVHPHPELGQFGESGETYAFDKTAGWFPTAASTTSLILLGLLPDQENSRSILQLLVRDPGGDITTGHRPTRAAPRLAAHLRGRRSGRRAAGVNVDGYRDYRGVPVVGAWKWLPEDDIGVVTEVDYAEAFRPLTILRWTFWGCSRCWR